MQKKRIYTIAASHLDTSWLWDLETSIREYIPNTLCRNFSIFEKYPEYTFAFEGSYRYELMEEYYPEAFEKLKEYVAAGRWQVTGSAFENGDVNTPSPEALFRNILYGNSYFRETFGKTSNDIFLPDCFGFGWSLPSIAAHANLKGFSTGKLAWGSAYGEPFDLGKWYGVDGKYIYANIKPGSYSRSVSKIREHNQIAPKLKANEEFGLPFTAAFYGTGDRGGAPGDSSVKAVIDELRLNDKSSVDVLSVSAPELFEAMDNELTEEQKGRLPIWNNELLLTDHGVGSYTSRAVGHRWNKNCERLADNAERSAVAAAWLGNAKYPQEALDTAWKRFIAHQFHDDITGTSFQVCYERNWNDYILSQNQFAHEYTSAVEGVAANMNTSFVKGVAVVVNNPLQCARQETVNAKIKLPEGTEYISVTNADGKPVASQILSSKGEDYEIAFSASVPSVGYAAFDVCPASNPYVDVHAIDVSSTHIENNKLRVKFNAAGDICEVFDKKLNINILSGVISLASFDYLGSRAWPAWELTYKELSAKPREFARSPKFKILEFGPARGAVEISRTVGKSTVRQIISLDANGDTLRVFNEVDWRSTRSLLKAVFPLNASNHTATYDLGLGVIKRKNNSPKLYEVPAQVWADITNSDNSFGVSIFSDSRSGWDKPENNTLRLTAVHTPFYSYRWECSQHLMDLGINRFSFGVFSHASDYTNGTQMAAARFNQPMTAFVTGAHEGELGSEFSFASISNNSVIIRAIKKAHRGDEIIVRFNEGSGKGCEGVRFSIGNGIESAREVFASEEYISAAAVENGELVFNIGRYEPKTFALTLKLPEINSEIPREQKIISLPFNSRAISSNSSRSSTLRNAISIPAELIPEHLVSGAVEFEISKSMRNALVCRGNEIEIPAGYNSLYLLAFSQNGDKRCRFAINGNGVTIGVQDWTQHVGKWDLIGLGETGRIKRDVLAWNATHAHNSKEDIIAKQLYVFKYEFDIPLEGAVLTLPEDEDIVILAATAVNRPAKLSLASELYDSLDKRAFDYKISRSEFIKANPSSVEKGLKRLDTRKSITVNAVNANSTIQIADAIAFVRSIFRK